MTRISRRDLLGVMGTTTAALAGCLGGGGTDSGDQADSMPAPVMGDPDAAVTVAVYEDFACPHCQSWVLEHLPSIERDYVESGEIRYEHHDFPIPVHEKWSWDVAVAARSVQDRAGDAAFFEFAHTMYENLGGYADSVVRQAANDVGADGDAVVDDMANDVFRPDVEADRNAGSDAGVRGTPTVFVNGQPLDSYAADAVSQAIDREL